MRSLLLIEAVKDVRQGFRRDATTGIRYGQHGPTLTIAILTADRNGDMATIRVFYRVGDKIVQDDRHHIFIEVHHDFRLRRHRSDNNIRVAVQLLIFQTDIAYTVHQITILRLQLSVRRFRLSEFQQLVDERLESLRALEDHSQRVFSVLRYVGMAGHVVERAKDQRQRRTQFVGDVGEEL